MGRYDGSHDELHMAAGSLRDYPPPQIKLDHAPPPSSAPPPRQHGASASASASALASSAHASASASAVPNVLQPGGMASRPHPMSSNTTPQMPGMHPSMPPHQHGLQQQPQSQQHSPMQEYPPANKPPLSLSHSYSRSSPAAGYDPGASSSYHAYTPTTPGGSSSQFTSTPDGGKYGAPGSQRNIANTPLGLADIRPRADSSMSDGSPSGMGYDVVNRQPGPSNYLAPWAVYAFDWCKWRPQGNSAGKIAVGSYLEDGHNFVRTLLLLARSPS